MKKIIATVACLGLITACGSRAVKNTAPTGTGEKVSGPILIENTVPFGPGAVAENVKNECTGLGSKLSKFTVSYGKENGVTVNKAKDVTKKTKGNALVMEIIRVHSSGNAFLGHNKSVTMKAALYNNGTLVDSVERTRSSGGGIGGGFKGSCSVLGRTVKTLGSDVAVWLKNYTI